LGWGWKVGNARKGASKEGPREVERYKGTLDMSGMAVTEKAQYLIQREYLGSQMEGTDKGAEAKSIRELVYMGGMQNVKTYNDLLEDSIKTSNKSKNLDQLLDINETFMNVTLRNFMRLNDDGTVFHSKDSLDKMVINKKETGWDTNPGNFFHRDPAYESVIKYENKRDGQEVIFGHKEENDTYTQILGNKYEGTANYATGGFPRILEHYKYDMVPYFNQYPEMEGFYSIVRRIVY
jgi:hypothetical protein